MASHAVLIVPDPVCYQTGVITASLDAKTGFTSMLMDTTMSMVMSAVSSGVSSKVMGLPSSKQTYTGLYEFVDGTMYTIEAQCVVMIEEIVAKINAYGKKVVFLGDGVPVFKEYLEDHLTVPYAFAPAMNNKQRASSVAVLGGILCEQGKAEEAQNHKPDYLRLSQAEREFQQKQRDFRI